MKCQKCGTEFDGNFCPNCGEPAQAGQAQEQPTHQTPLMGKRRIRKKLNPGQIVGITFGSIFLFIALIVILASAFSSEGSGGSSAVAAGVTTTSAPDVMKVDYKTLYKDYDANPINADSKYRDKKLQLTGTIANIDRDIGQSPYITFNVDEYGAQSIKMSFDDDKTVAALKKGQKVTVEGTCGGTFTSTLVVLNDCSIVK